MSIRDDTEHHARTLLEAYEHQRNEHGHEYALNYVCMVGGKAIQQRNEMSNAIRFMRLHQEKPVEGERNDDEN